MTILLYIRNTLWIWCNFCLDSIHVLGVNVIWIVLTHCMRTFGSSFQGNVDKYYSFRPYRNTYKGRETFYDKTTQCKMFWIWKLKKDEERKSNVKRIILCTCRSYIQRDKNWLYYLFVFLHSSNASRRRIVQKWRSFYCLTHRWFHRATRIRSNFFYSLPFFHLECNLLKSNVLL